MEQLIKQDGFTRDHDRETLQACLFIGINKHACSCGVCSVESRKCMHGSVAQHTVFNGYLRDTLRFFGAAWEPL